jgi:hypothetical protein
MNYLRHVVLCASFLIGGPSVALEFKKTDFQLLSLTGTSDFSKVKVWSGMFSDYSGRKWDTSSLYQSDDPHINLKASVLQRLTDRVLLVHGFTFDTGYRSALYEMTPEIGYHPSVIFMPDRNTTLSIHLSGFFKYGGRSTERPCVDDFDREFHCGTGLPWVDSKNFHIKAVRNTALSLSARFVF